MGRLLMNAWYKYSSPPWVLGPREELVDAVATGRFVPGRVLDMGCGAGDNAVFLAKRGFDVVGVDYAPAAIDRARASADQAGVEAQFLACSYFDLPDLGTFDAVLDFGSGDDLSAPDRERFRDVVCKHLRPGGQMFLWCFSYESRAWERAIARMTNSGVALTRADVDALYGEEFDIELLGQVQKAGFPPGYAHYLLTRKGGAP